MFIAFKTPVLILSPQWLISHGIAAPAAVKLPHQRILLRFSLHRNPTMKTTHLFIYLCRDKRLVMILYGFPLRFRRFNPRFTSHIFSSGSAVCHFSQIKPVIQNPPNSLRAPRPDFPISVHFIRMPYLHRGWNPFFVQYPRNLRAAVSRICQRKNISNNRSLIRLHHNSVFCLPAFFIPKRHCPECKFSICAFTAYRRLYFYGDILAV